MNKLSFKQFDELLESGEKFVLLDVRNTDEFAHGHFDTAVNIPLHLLPLTYQDELPDTQATIITYCMRGGRSGQAAEFLEEKGYSHVMLLEGGYFGYLEQTLSKKKE